MIYTGGGSFDYEMELLDPVSFICIIFCKSYNVMIIFQESDSPNSGKTQVTNRCTSLQVSKGIITVDDFVKKDIVDILFDKPIPIKVIV